jgi:hypothetical protein
MPVGRSLFNTGRAAHHDPRRIFYCLVPIQESCEDIPSGCAIPQNFVQCEKIFSRLQGMEQKKLRIDAIFAPDFQRLRTLR